MKRILRLSLVAGVITASWLACLPPGPHAYAQAVWVRRPIYNVYGQGYYGGYSPDYYNAYGPSYGGRYVYVPNWYSGFGDGPYGAGYYPGYNTAPNYDPFYGRPRYVAPAFGY
jgi:hypothetical protein